MSSYQFTDKDSKQLKNHGLTEQIATEQLEQFQKGTAYVQLTEAATIGHGIFAFDEQTRNKYINLYEKTNQEAVKFVPSSGAASRMFRLLLELIQNFNPKKDTFKKVLEQEKFRSLQTFFTKLEQLPFYNQVKTDLKAKYRDFTLNSDQGKYEFVRFILEDLDFAALPKGLIPFHHYTDKTATAFEEQLEEGKQYAANDGIARLHFTVAENHLDRFKTVLEQVRNRVETQDKKLDVSFSFQEQSTDTIAAHTDNKPFRNDDGTLVLRPGGHGALIENLNNINTDLVFIKNIDNVITQDRLPSISAHKKALGGLLIKVQDKIFSLLQDIDKQGFTKEIGKTAEEIANHHFFQNKPFNSEQSIRSFYNRPLRVCGVVENTGAPGGGPFWVKDEGKTTLQIIEHPQIDTAQKDQAEILENATHFSPTDIVCGLKDYQGNKFDLKEYIDTNQSFITYKSKNGKDLKALELPGLWNGAMAFWNTIFVEVPLTTFNPVKTVVDLLNPEHQPKS